MSSIARNINAGKFGTWLKALDDGALMRSVFYALLAGVVITILLDYRTLALGDQAVLMPQTARPILPAANPAEDDGGTQPKVETPAEQLRDPLAITLQSGGVLLLRGTIEPGSADRFASEITRIGEYVKRVELDSPGGSVEDALAIAMLVRDRDFATHVGSGRLCASSCPLILAGGKNRSADEGAAIGVHQIFSSAGDQTPSREAVASTQRTTAKITRNLAEWNVDPALWLHALDTPPERLYYLSREELQRYRLINS